MCTAAIVPTLLGLARRFDDFVTPPAIDLLCLLFDEGDIHVWVIARPITDFWWTAPMHILVNSALPLFVDMTGKASDAVRQTGAKALAEFAKYGMLPLSSEWWQYLTMKRSLIDEQGLIKGGYVNKLAKQAINCGAVHQDGAIRSLLALPPQGNGVSYIPQWVLMPFLPCSSPNNSARCTYKGQNRREPHFSAAKEIALSGCGFCISLTDGHWQVGSSWIKLWPNINADHVAKTVIGSEAPVYICNMLKRRWFDGHDGEDGVSTLQRVLGIGKI